MDVGLLQVDSLILQVGGVNRWIEPFYRYTALLYVGTALLQMDGGVTGA